MFTVLGVIGLSFLVGGAFLICLKNSRSLGFSFLLISIVLSFAAFSAQYREGTGWPADYRQLDMGEMYTLDHYWDDPESEKSAPETFCVFKDEEGKIRLFRLSMDDFSVTSFPDKFFLKENMDGKGYEVIEIKQE